MAFELELFYKTLDWSRKWPVDFNAGKTQIFFFDWSNNTSAIDMKMDGSVLEENSSFKMLWLICSFKLDWGCYIISIAKIASKKIGAMISSMKFLSPEASFISINPPYSHVWNTIVMSEMALLVAT